MTFTEKAQAPLLRFQAASIANSRARPPSFASVAQLPRTSQSRYSHESRVFQRREEAGQKGLLWSRAQCFERGRNGAARNAARLAARPTQRQRIEREMTLVGLLFISRSHCLHCPPAPRAVALSSRAFSSQPSAVLLIWPDENTNSEASRDSRLVSPARTRDKENGAAIYRFADRQRCASAE